MHRVRHPFAMRASNLTTGQLRKRRMRAIGLLAVAVGSVSISASVGAATNNLTGTANGNSWNTTTNWSLGHVPTTTDALLINGSSQVTSGLANSFTSIALSFDIGSSTINVNATAAGGTATNRTLTLSSGFRPAMKSPSVR